MTDNVLNFPKQDRMTPDAILSDAQGKYDTCIVIGVTPDGKAEYSICASGSEQVIYLIRMLEHLVFENELT